jgi:beta-glucosidase
MDDGISDAFANYAEVCFNAFGDRVKNWITINEAWVVAILGYGHGVFAPGKKSGDLPYIVGHNLLKAHGKAVDVYNRKYRATQKEE